MCEEEEDEAPEIMELRPLASRDSKSSSLFAEGVAKGRPLVSRDSKSSSLHTEGMTKGEVQENGAVLIDTSGTNTPQRPRAGTNTPYRSRAGTTTSYRFRKRLYATFSNKLYLLFFPP